MRQSRTRPLLENPVQRGVIERALRESEERYERLLTLTPDAVVLQAGGAIQFANPAAAALLAGDAEALVGRSLAEFVDAPAAFSAGAMAPTMPVETTVRRLDGATIPAEVTAIPIPWHGESALQVVIRDITDRKRAEEKLHRQALAFENLYDAVIISDLEGRIVDWNPAAERIYGFSRGEVLGKTAELWHPQSGGREVSEEIVRALQTEGRWFGEIRYQRKDGETGVTETIVVPLLDEHGHRIGHVGVNHDITQRLRARRELEASLSILQATLESTTDGILVVDNETRVVNYNRKFTEMWSVTRAMLTQEPVRRLLDHVAAQVDGGDAFLAKLQEIAERREQQSFDMVRLKDGRAYEMYSLPQWVNGESVGRVWSFRDVTERERSERLLRESEEQLRQSQKLEAIGLLAGGIAHDFSNLITVIQAYTDTLHRTEIDPAHRQDLAEIRRVLDQGTMLTRKLLAFGRKQVVHRRVVDVNAIVDDTRQMLRRVIGEDVTLHTHLSPDVGFVMADQGQLEQVLLNLAVNARDAMPDGGTLTIETSRVDADPDFARRRMGVDVRPGPYVVISVGDTGHGMDETTRQHVFEPFYTTKSAGRGTGLGLSTVYGVVKQNEGFIWFDSEIGKGTTFHLYFPQVDSASQPEPVVPAEIRPGVATVMLVEDDDDLRAVVGAALARHGYTVLTARNGEEAQAAAAGSATLDLIVCDVVLPRLTGPDVVMRVRERHPDARALFVSGYVPSQAIRERMRTVSGVLLEKPFTLDALLERVQSVLES